ncbi:MFS general substrate transporter [Marasmius fiardii PR-910]|nr:MFS general substrate transporter [Marasmius fiardii PR-910]
MSEFIQLETLSKRVHTESYPVDVLLHTSSRSSARNVVEAPTTTDSGSPSSFVQTRSQIKTARIQLATLFWTLFLAGWNDGTTGPLLPKIQQVYHVNDTFVSVIFILACVGCIAGACLNVPLSDKYGFGKMLAFGKSSILQTIGYALQSANVPFPVFVIAYTINGVGLSIQDAQANGFVAALKKNAETKMGLLHAVYGVGAFAAPLVSTRFSRLERWHFYFLCSLGFAIINTTLVVLIFRFKVQEVCLEQIGQPAGEQNQNQDSPTRNHGTFRQILSHRNVHLMAFFILVYVGVEVTIGGWIVTFVIRERHGGPDAGYISSGFFGGLALGRVLLLWFNKLVGERNAMFIYAALAIGLELVVWLVPSLISGAVAVSFVGFLLGPMYPITMNYAGCTLPRWILTGAIGWIAGFGQAGSAVFPFMTGALAGKFGIKSLQPLLVAMMVGMMILWGVLCLTGRRRKE